MIYLAFVLLLIVSPVHAATLLWDVQPSGGGSIVVERSDAPTGTFATVATVPEGTTSYILTPGLWGHYRVQNTVGPSNTVLYSADLYSGGVTDRLDAIEARVTALEQPVSPPASNFAITHIDLNHIRIVCNGIGITTSGSGTSRTMECRQ